MIYRSIANTELRPSAICLGTAEMGTVMKEEDAYKILDAYVECGGNFLDTAHVYGDMESREQGMSEKTIGKWMQKNRSRRKVLIATKGGMPHHTSLNIKRLSGKEIVSDLEESLRFLKIDEIDLYYLHRDDPDRTVSEIIDTLDEQVKAGKIRYYGLSNWKLSRFRQAVEYAEENGKAAPAASQILWSLAKPDYEAIGDHTIAMMEDETWEFHKKTQIAVCPYTSQARGFFTILKNGGESLLKDWVKATYYSDENLERYRRALEVADKNNYPLEAVVLLYLIGQPFTTIPVISSRNLEQLKLSLKAGELSLSAEEAAYLDNSISRYGKGHG